MADGLCPWKLMGLKGFGGYLLSIVNWDAMANREFRGLEALWC